MDGNKTYGRVISKSPDGGERLRTDVDVFFVIPLLEVNRMVKYHDCGEKRFDVGTVDQFQKFHG
jgi:hypothetical protein